PLQGQVRLHRPHPLRIRPLLRRRPPFPARLPNRHNSHRAIRPIGGARIRSRLWRWVIPIGGGLLSAILIVVATPHVSWYLRAGQELIAFFYIDGQAAAYLWSIWDQGN